MRWTKTVEVNQGMKALVERPESLRELARLTGASRSSLARWRSGACTPSERERERLRLVLGIHPIAWDYLLRPGDRIEAPFSRRGGRPRRSDA